jgi:tRNA A37 threonylcarbamoyladenosine biosynthesis protein TsaE
MQSMDKIVEDVMAKYRQRSELGIAKYGTTLDENKATLIEWLTHLQEELMDATLYIQKLKSDLDK